MKRMITLAIALLLPLPLLAQDWVFLPGGVIGVNARYTTHASFSCVSRYVYAGFSCAASGQGVVFTSGDATLAIDFIGVDEDLLITNLDHVIPIGQFSSVLTGPGPFMFPQTPWNDVGDLFRVSVTVGNSGYFLSTNTARAFGLADGSLRPLDLNPGYLAGGVTVNPAPPGYGYAIFSTVKGPIVLNRETGVSTLTADVALSGFPEPSTFALVLPGIVGFVVFQRRRK